MKIIETYTGDEVIVDNRDYKKLSGFKWFYRNRGNASSKSIFRTGKGNGRYILMAGDITGINAFKHPYFIDGNILNHRRKNIVMLTLSQFRRTYPPKSGKKYKGISICRIKDYPFFTSIEFKGKYIRLGYFYSDKEAAEMYDAAIDYLGFEYAYKNFPDGEFELSKKVKIKLDEVMGEPASGTEAIR